MSDASELMTGRPGPPSSLTRTARLNTAALDSRRGVVRLHPEVIAALGIREWDAVSLTGSRTTAAVAGATTEWQWRSPCHRSGGRAGPCARSSFGKSNLARILLSRYPRCFLLPRWGTRCEPLPRAIEAVSKPE